MQLAPAIDYVREDVSALVVDDNSDTCRSLGKDVLEVSIPWKDSNNKPHNYGVTIEFLQDWLESVALKVKYRFIPLNGVLGEVLEVADIREDAFLQLDDIHHGMLERRASHEIQVDDTCVHRCTGRLPDREKVAVDVNLTFLVGLVLVDIVRVDLFRNRTRVDIW